MSKALPPSLYNEVVSGLQMMLALRLSGSPAADTILATVQAWEIALVRDRKWDEQQDRGRFRVGFERLAGEITWWPAPADLLKRLPPRPEPLKLDYHYQQTDDDKAKAKEALKGIKQAINQVLNGKLHKKGQ